MPATPFLQIAAADAVTAFVATKLAGGSDSEAQDAAKGRGGSFTTCNNWPCNSRSFRNSLLPSSEALSTTMIS